MIQHERKEQESKTKKGGKTMKKRFLSLTLAASVIICGGGYFNSGNSVCCD